MAVYHKDRPDYLIRAINSVIECQSRMADEIIVIIDGPIPVELEHVISCYECQYSDRFRVLRLPENKGLGNALRVGVRTAKYDIIARMDSDDVADPGRFEKQLSYLGDHPECDIVGGQITEFIGEETNIVGQRSVPFNNNDIYSYMKSRCPFNHMSVMFRKKSVLDVGNYVDWLYNEDYFLWIRMAEAGCKFANLPDTLVNVRVGKDMYQRRGGWRYFRSEARLQGYMLNHKIISFPRYLYNVAGRFAVQVVMPNWLRGFVFQKMFRK